MSRTRLWMMFIRYDLSHWLECLWRGVSPRWLWGWQQRTNNARCRVAEIAAREAE